MTLTKKELKQAKKDLRKGIIHCSNCFKEVNIYSENRGFCFQTDKKMFTIRPYCPECFDKLNLKKEKAEELKTLKDMEFISENYTNKRLRKESQGLNQMVRDKLKAEAIKRWKYYQKLINEYKSSNHTIDWTIQIWQAKQEELIEFNNLTEADLQENYIKEEQKEPDIKDIVGVNHPAELGQI